MKKISLSKKDWIGIVGGVVAGIGLPHLSGLYGEFTAGLILKSKPAEGLGSPTWSGLLKGALEKTNRTKQDEVDKLNNKIKHTTNLVTGLSCGIYELLIDSIVHKRIKITGVNFGLATAIGFAISYGIPHPKQTVITKTNLIS